MLDIYDFYITPNEYDTALKNGISRKLLDRRVRDYAWDKLSATTKVPTCQNKDLKIYLDKAAKNGIKAGTFLTRIRKLGWTFEKSINTPARNNKQAMKERGYNSRKYPVDVLEKVKSNGIDINTFYARIKKGWDITKASETPTLTKSQVAKLGNEAYYKLHGHKFSA